MPDTIEDLLPWEQDSQWHHQLGEEFRKEYFSQLQSFLNSEYSEHDVFPPRREVFAAFRQTPFQSVRFVILGQDPYHDHGQANGLSFSVREGVKFPPSLRNIFRELVDDIGCAAPQSGDLTKWAQQGGLLLNAVLTVRAHQPNSHKDRGWETFTDAAIRALNRSDHKVVFVLWGRHAQKKKSSIDLEHHAVIESPHPSPLSASRGFFGSKPFSRINEILESNGQPAIQWAL